MGWEQLRGGVELPIDPAIVVPRLTEVRLAMPHVEAVGDVETATRDEVTGRLGADVEPGMTVAVGAGSRGITARVELVRATVDALRSLGAEPFVVPAMGSHGGATAEGQRAMLAGLGVTPESVGADIRSTMETLVVAHDRARRSVHLDAHAAGADRIVPVNRVKPHTAFHGPIESGCTKMAVVGFGKRAGAAQFHAGGAGEMRARLADGVEALRDRLLGGVATVEGATGDVVAVRVLTAAEMGGAVEEELTAQAKRLVPRLPFAEIDVLVVERGGKDISGTTLDPNVTGRFWIEGLDDPPSPHVASIVLLDLTDVTAGNVLGIGLADFVPAALAGRIDWSATYLNAITAGGTGVRRARLPMVLADEESCVRAALATCGRPPGRPARVVRIASTLHLERCWVSDALLDELPDARERSGRRVVPMVDGTFFTIDGDRFVPTDLARGPWDPDACHAGPPTALMARALEQALPHLRLARISVDLGRPVPMSRFSVHAEVVRAGRATGNSRVTIVDGDGDERVSATGMHIGAAAMALFEQRLDNTGASAPRLADAVPGEFPIGPFRHPLPGFRDAVEVRYPEGEDHHPGATTVWMRTVALLPDEEPSPFQRICPLADCGNAFSRHAEPDRVQFVNTDLVIALHRDPAGEWLGSTVGSTWQPSGIGLADALLFDDDGPVGRALQTLLLRPAP